MRRLLSIVAAAASGAIAAHSAVTALGPSFEAGALVEFTMADLESTYRIDAALPLNVRLFERGGALSVVGYGYSEAEAERAAAAAARWLVADAERLRFRRLADRVAREAAQVLRTSVETTASINRPAPPPPSETSRALETRFALRQIREPRDLDAFALSLPAQIRESREVFARERDMVSTLAATYGSRHPSLIAARRRLAAAEEAVMSSVANYIASLPDDAPVPAIAARSDLEARDLAPTRSNPGDNATFAMQEIPAHTVADPSLVASDDLEGDPFERAVQDLDRAKNAMGSAPVLTPASRTALGVAKPYAAPLGAALAIIAVIALDLSRRKRRDPGEAGLGALVPSESQVDEESRTPRLEGAVAAQAQISSRDAKPAARGRGRLWEAAGDVTTTIVTADAKHGTLADLEAVRLALDLSASGLRVLVVDASQSGSITEMSHANPAPEQLEIVPLESAGAPVAILRLPDLALASPESFRAERARTHLLLFKSGYDRMIVRADSAGALVGKLAASSSIEVRVSSQGRATAFDTRPFASAPLADAA